MGTVNTYHCTVCQKSHYDTGKGKEEYDAHLKHQSKEGIKQFETAEDVTPTWESVLMIHTNFLIERVRTGGNYQSVREEILKVGRAFDKFKHVNKEDIEIFFLFDKEIDKILELLNEENLKWTKEKIIEISFKMNEIFKSKKDKMRIEDLNNFIEGAFIEMSSSEKDIFLNEGIEINFSNGWLSDIGYNTLIDLRKNQQ